MAASGCSATAAIALSQRVLDGGTKELADYLSFLGGGCSKYPLDLLRDAAARHGLQFAPDTSTSRQA